MHLKGLRLKTLPYETAIYLLDTANSRKQKISETAGIRSSQFVCVNWQFENKQQIENSCKVGEAMLSMRSVLSGAVVQLRHAICLGLYFQLMLISIYWPYRDVRLIVSLECVLHRGPCQTPGYNNSRFHHMPLSTRLDLHGLLTTRGRGEVKFSSLCYW